MPPRTALGPQVVPVSADASAERILAAASSLRPSVRQWAWQQRGLSAFIHFGINTFADREWGDGTEDPGLFDPTGPVDTDAWMRELAETGFERVIFTAKHHDGFVLWPSRYTEFGVSSSPWLDGQGDLLALVAESARAHGMEFGVYLSPADSHQELTGLFGNGSAPSPRSIPALVDGDDRAGADLPRFTVDATDYGSYYLNLLYEVLTQYGPIGEIWFDGAQGHTGRVEPYDFPAFYEMVRALQPEALTAIEGEQVRWVGNEDGIARVDEWSPVAVGRKSNGALALDAQDPLLGSDEQLVEAVRSGRATELRWFPAEADLTLTQGWFAHDDDEPKSAERLLELHTQSVGRNAVFLMNVPPTTAGAFAPASVAALRAFADLRRATYADDAAAGLPIRADGDRFEVALGTPARVARIQLGEDTLHSGQQITGFRIEGRVDDTWHVLAGGGAVGASRIVVLDEPAEIDAVRVVVTGARGPADLTRVALWRARD